MNDEQARPTATADATLEADALPEKLAEAVSSAEQGSRVALTRKGKPIAFLVPVEDAEALEALEDAADAKAIREGRAAYAREGHTWPTYTIEEFAARWGDDPAS